MVVYDRSYARWDGDRDAPVRGTWVILERGLRTATAALFRRRFFAVLLCFGAYGPFLFSLGVLFFAYWAQANLGAEFAADMSEAVAMVTPNPDTMWGFLLEIQLGVTLILCLLVGSGLVADDRRTNALELYLSRPVTARQYVLGKLAVIVTFLSLVTIVPACVIILVQMGLSTKDVLSLADLMWRTALAGAVLVVPLGLLMLAASSLAARPRNAAILWAGFLLMVDGLLASLLTSVFSSPSLQLVSLRFNAGQLMAWILGNAEEIDPDVPVTSSAAVATLWCLLALVIVRRRVRPVEVVA